MRERERDIHDDAFRVVLPLPHYPRERVGVRATDPIDKEVTVD
jgi:hypothetical protein